MSQQIITRTPDAKGARLLSRFNSHKQNQDEKAFALTKNGSAILFTA
ncbi:MAG TPA: hypothetical protein VGH19_00290 [Verrucomicrobiae bacterium]